MATCGAGGGLTPAERECRAARAPERLERRSSTPRRAHPRGHAPGTPPALPLFDTRFARSKQPAATSREDSRGLEIDGELVFRGLLHWDVSGLRTLGGSLDPGAIKHPRDADLRHETLNLARTTVPSRHSTLPPSQCDRMSAPIPGTRVGPGRSHTSTADHPRTACTTHDTW